MSILSGVSFPLSMASGTPSAPITLSPTALIATTTGLGLTGRWATSTNWSSVEFVYTDPTGINRELLTFYSVGNTWPTQTFNV